MPADTSISPTAGDPPGNPSAGQARANPPAPPLPAEAPADERKATWRAWLRHQLSGIDSATREELSSRIRGHLAAAGDQLWPGAAAGDPRRRFICLIFAGTEREPALLPLLKGDPAVSADAGVEISWALPKVRPEGQLSLHRVTDPERDLQPGAYGLLEPDPDRCPAIAAADIALALVPGLGFAGGGLRLGQGGGYYDRLLPRLPRHCPVVGIGFQLQWFPTPPWNIRPHDRPVEAVVTEAGWAMPCKR